MRIRHTGRYVTFTSDSDTERSELELIAGDIAGQQFRVDSVNGDTLSLRQTGNAEGKSKGDKRQAAAPRKMEAINITFDTTPMPLRLISNLAETSFELDGRSYASVEGFWQGLKFTDEADRLRVAELSGHAAKAAGPKAQPGDRFIYEDREFVVGTVDHWELMERANRAKFEQDEDARTALLSTGDRPLVHLVVPDSRTIPGIIMADIWTRIRAELAVAAEG
jgi:predicted NAD-dependent protein-ADP-ribosyltransferase YbiA (DUF1768 family)